MFITSVRCPVLQANVSRVTDLEGVVTSVICPEYVKANGSCRLVNRARNGGPLSQLLERLANDTRDNRTARCSLH
jgi:hypothetical protein